MSLIRFCFALPSDRATRGRAEVLFHIGCFGVSYSLPSNSSTLASGYEMSWILFRFTQYRFPCGLARSRLVPAKRPWSWKKTGGDPEKHGNIHVKSDCALPPVLVATQFCSARSLGAMFDFSRELVSFSAQKVCATQ